MTTLNALLCVAHVLLDRGPQVTLGIGGELDLDPRYCFSKLDLASGII